MLLCDFGDLRHDGKAMKNADWNNPHTASLGMLLPGRGIDDVDEDGTPLVDDDLFLVVNASDHTLDFRMPRPTTRGTFWELLVATVDDALAETAEPGGHILVGARELKLFHARPRTPA